MAMNMKIDRTSFADQFKDLDRRDPSTWPLLPKIAMTIFAMVLVLAGGYFADWQLQLEELEAGKITEVKLKDEYKAKHTQAVNLELYKKQLSDVNQLLGTMLRQLPNRSQMDTLITDINNAGLSRNLSFELFKPASQETKKEIYAELPITIKVAGKYHDMGLFVADIGQLSRIVTINDLYINTTPIGTPSPMLVMEATAKTFRYLDEEELNEVRAEKAKVAKAKAPAAKPPAK